MKTVFITLILALFTFLSASTVVGNVQKVTGSVKVKSQGSFKKSKVKSGQEVKEGDLITTSRKGKTVIKLVDGSSIVLDVSSSVHFASVKDIEQKGGKVLYKITSRDAKNSLKVKTPFAIIGIKGTTFVINSNEGKQSVALKEGKIGVASIKEQFSLYRKEMMAQFNAYKNAQIAGFNKYKGIKEPKPEITKEFDLEAGNVISFEGNVVKEHAWNDSADSEFGEFGDMMDSGANAAFSKPIDGSDEFGEPADLKGNSLEDDVENSMKF